MKVIALLTGLGLLVAATVADAAPCKKFPDHPDCQGGGGGGEDPPPVASDPAYAYVFERSIYVINAGGTEEAPPIEFLAGERPRGPNNPGITYRRAEWDPTGEKLAYSRNNELEYMKLADGSTVHLGGGWDDAISWSANGEYIAFDRWKGSRADIYAANVAQDGSGPAIPVTDTVLPIPTPSGGGWDGPYFTSPSWSPDGTRLVFRHWSFSITPEEDIYDILICEPFNHEAPEPTCDATNTVVWKAFDDSYHRAPVWHPSLDAIAHVPVGHDLLIESSSVVEGVPVPFLGDTSCIQLYNSNTTSRAVLRDDCVTIDVGYFYFRGNFDWSCDGNSLVVTGNYDDEDLLRAGNYGIHRIDNVFDPNEPVNIVPLVTVDDFTEHPRSPASRCTAN